MLACHRRQINRAHDVAVEPGGELLRLHSERATGRPGEVLGEDDVDPTIVLLAPDADDAAVPPGGGSAVAVAVEDLVDVVAEMEAALLPAHGARVECGQQGGPRA